MGQIARQNQAERFIEEFGKDFLATVLLTPGETWTYTGSYLGIRDIDSAVVLMHKFRRADADGERELALEDETLFDPDCTTGEDLIENEFHERLGLTEAEFAERIKRASL